MRFPLLSIVLPAIVACAACGSSDTDPNPIDAGGDATASDSAASDAAKDAADSSPDSPVDSPVDSSSADSGVDAPAETGLDSSPDVADATDAADSSTADTDVDAGSDVETDTTDAADAVADDTIDAADAGTDTADAADTTDATDTADAADASDTADTADAAPTTFVLTIDDYASWCSIAVNGGTSSAAPLQTYTLAAGSTASLDGAPASSSFIWRRWVGTSGDVSSAHDTSPSTTVVMSSDKTVKVCCPFTDGSGCPAGY